MGKSPLTLNLVQGSVSFGFTPEAARNLQAEIAQLVKILKVNASGNQKLGEKPSPKANLEYRYTGDVFFEVFCNPNIYPSPFAAKVLLTLRDDRIRLSTEAELPRMIEDLNLYLEQVG